MALKLSKPRRALITGAGSGIGQALCSSLALDHGWACIATDLNLEGAQVTATQITESGGVAEAHALDVADNKQIEALVEKLTNTGGLVEVVINNDLTRAVLPIMREQGFGRVINIGSIHSVVASPFKSAYVAAKHGLIGFSKVIALETHDVDITINTICPSYVKTPLVDAQIVAQAKSHGISEEEVINKIMLEPMPKKRFITTEELVGTVLYLTSDTAKNVTGQALVIDGGWTIR